MSRSHVGVVRLGCLRGLLLIVCYLVLMVLPGMTMAAGPGFAIRSLAQPSYFSSGVDASCLSFSGSRLCNSYRLVVTNVGTTSTTTPIVVSDVLPSNISVASIHAEDLSQELNFSQGCTVVPLQCVDEQLLAPGGALLIVINVTIEPGASEVVTNRASVTGGGALPVTTDEATSPPTRITSTLPAFGMADFNMQPFDADGTASAQAGGHPYSLLTSIDFDTIDQVVEGEGEYSASEQPKDIIVDLPVGLIGNPESVPHCPLNALERGTGITLCPPDSRVGTVVLEHQPGFFAASETPQAITTAIYNLVPEDGYPAEFGFTFDNRPAFMYANVVRMNGTYRLRVVAPGLPVIGVDGVSLLFFGNPSERDGSGSSGQSFFSNPVACTSEQVNASAQADSWQHPGEYVSKETTVYPQITGCNLLQFQPSLRVGPDTTQADEPSGYTVQLEVPQRESLGTPATPELRNATVTLPPGVSLDPAAADGLRTCAETGPKGINIVGPEATEMGEGDRDGSPYHDGMEHTAPGHCPAASTVGSVEVTTPVLAQPLEGHLFLAEPKCGETGRPECTPADASNGNLFGMYLEAAGSGAIVKLRGTVSVNPTTGQVSTTFEENPQLPFSNLTLRVKGGVRAALANPQTCEQALSSSQLVPWSTPVTPNATPLSEFNVDWDGSGGACPASLPFAPSFSAGTVLPSAGAFTPLTVTISRGDREQDLSQVSVHTPVGLLGMLSKVTLCGEAQAAAGTCSADSQIGSTAASAGAGSHPFWIQGGRVYLTGPYRGAPFGLSIVVPAVAGPFNLGNVVVRASISVDPHTSELTVTSDPLPQIIDGVPLRLRTINVSIDKPGFIFNPTNCNALRITGTLASAQGATAAVSTPFAVGGCANLPFKTKFAVFSQAKTSKKNGASLDVKVSDVPGQANIAKVAVTLPKMLPSRLTTIQHACPEAVFAANPATCDPKSLIGMATGVSPVLPVKLIGPAYLVSHGGAAFPDVVVILQGEGVRVDLVGNVNITKGITHSTFASVPDVPINSFELRLPQGPHSALTTASLPATAHGSLCGQKLLMPTTITGQNGAQIKQNTKIAITGCTKVKKARTREKGLKH